MPPQQQPACGKNSSSNTDECTKSPTTSKKKLSVHSSEAVKYKSYSKDADPLLLAKVMQLLMNKSVLLTLHLQLFLIFEPGAAAAAAVDTEPAHC